MEQWDAILDAFAPGSSDVDWCEPNYVITENIAEFFNTISNILFFVCPCILIGLFQPYARQISWGCHVVWFFLLVIGAGSTYFHASLSLAGQLLDEFGILWIFNAALAIWIPKAYLPLGRREMNLVRYQVLVLILTVVGTLLGCVYPLVNALVLMTFGVPAAIIMWKEIKRSTEQRVKSLGFRTVGLWAAAVSIWISDRILCSLWISIGFPYLHSIWHILISVMSYSAIVFFAYVDSKDRFSDMMPELAYWPQS
ncbi:hypothetical protein CAPTEDRAFT_151749, partial [Capitella teleta]